jgi:uncharacterized membrane protein
MLQPWVFYFVSSIASAYNLCQKTVVGWLFGLFGCLVWFGLLFVVCCLLFVVVVVVVVAHFSIQRQ